MDESTDAKIMVQKMIQMQRWLPVINDSLGRALNDGNMANTARVVDTMREMASAPDIFKDHPTLAKAHTDFKQKLRDLISRAETVLMMAERGECVDRLISKFAQQH